MTNKMNPKWLYRLEFKDSSCGLWYDGNGNWCFESGIGSVQGCKTKTLPMGYDERYKQDGRNWFSSCSNKEDLMHWYSLDDAKELINKGFVFTRYLATEYHEYQQETVFIKETSLFREEIDISDLFNQSIIEDKLPRIHGYVARNKEPNELIFIPGDEPPTRMYNYWFCGFTWSYTVIPDVYPEISWESEPVEIELLIRKI